MHRALVSLPHHTCEEAGVEVEAAQRGGKATQPLEAAVVHACRGLMQGDPLWGLLTLLLHWQPAICLQSPAPQKPEPPPSDRLSLPTCEGEVEALQLAHARHRAHRVIAGARVAAMSHNRGSRGAQLSTIEGSQTCLPACLPAEPWHLSFHPPKTHGTPT